MNKRERDFLSRLFKLLGSVPYGKDGSGASTSSVVGVMQYQKDMKVFDPKLRYCMLAILSEQNCKDELEDLTPFKTVEENIKDLEDWVSKRNKEHWELK